MPNVTLFLTRHPAHEFVYESNEELHTHATSHRGQPTLIGQGVSANSSDDQARIKQYYMNDRQRHAFDIAQQKAQHARHPRTLTATAQRTRKSGRWRLLGMLVGPAVYAARLTSAPSGTAASLAAGIIDASIGGGLGGIAAPENALQSCHSFQGRSLELISSSERVIAPLTMFRSMERHRGNDGTSGYVALPKSTSPYDFFAQTGNSVVKKLKSEPHGRCLRVTARSAHDHGLSSLQEAILIHPAPSIGWLIGCISVRPLGDDGPYDDKLPNPSAECFTTIFNAVTSWGGNKVRLFVLA